MIMVRYETPALVDLNESAIGFGASCGGGSNATWACMPTGNRATGGCDTGSSDGSWCDAGISGAVHLQT